LYGYPQPHVQPKVNGKSVQTRKVWKPKSSNVSSFVTSSVSIGVPPILTKSRNLVKSMPSIYKPRSMSKLHVKPLKKPNVEPYVRSSGMVSVVANNINEESVFVTPSKTDVVGPIKETLTEPDVASDVTISLAQPDHIKFESAFDNGKSQCKMMSVGDEKDGSRSDDQSVWSFLISLSEFMAKKGE
jgi:hypothetical protein